MNTVFPWRHKPRQIAMRNAKIRPIAVPNSVDSRPHEDPLVRLPGENESINDRDTGWIDQLPRGQDYWNARRAFLRSYHFSENHDGFGGKLKRSVKGMNKAAAMGVVLEVRQEMSKRRFMVRVFRVRITFPSMVHVCVKCFVPSFRKVDKLRL